MSTTVTIQTDDLKVITDLAEFFTDPSAVEIPDHDETAVGSTDEEFSFGKNYDMGYNAGLDFAAAHLLSNLSALYDVFIQGGLPAVEQVIRDEAKAARR